MLKKIGLLIIAMLALTSAAQPGKGDWRMHPYYVSQNIKNIIDTDTKVYYLVGNDLYCYDKANGSNDALNKRGLLNDVIINGIYYNHDKRYLVVTYLNSNIDVVYDNGQVVNLPDIKDLVLTQTKAIYDVTFAHNKMMVATDFGFLVYDDNTMHAIESRLFALAFGSVIEVGEWTVVTRSGYVYAAKTATLRESYGSYVQVKGIAASSTVRLIPVSDTRFMVNCAAGLTTYTIDVDSDGKPMATSSDVIYEKRATTVQRTPTGFLASFGSAGVYIATDAQGANPQVLGQSTELFSANPHGDGTMWALGANGLHRADDTQHYNKPDGIGIKAGAFYLTFNKSKNLMYLSASSDNNMAEWGSKMGAVTSIFTHDGSQWRDVTPGSLPGNGVSANWQLVMDPMDPNTYVYPSRKYGVFKITNDQFAYQYGTSNSYFAKDKYYKGACAFDSDGNLWVVYSSENASTTSANNVAVLPRAKYEQATCTQADWIAVPVPATKQKYFKGSSFVNGKGDVKVYNGGGYQNSFVFWRMPNGLNGEPEIANYNSLQDTEGKSITWLGVYCMEKDLDGIVWAGLNSGIVAFDPTEAFNDNFKVIHPKVKRNDGTGLYDQLLEGLQINCVGVDANNCKWIGTNTSGLYQVSPDGSKILKEFNVDNSYLPSNTIYSVCCNTNTNSVYVLTAQGCVEYMSDASPAALNYDDVYVYPNPVRPDFTGLLTITNLMSNSYLTIVNAQGTTVKQWQAEGGTATWDCCDTTGQRMPTGLYTVYASQQANDRNPQKVAQFLIIK